MKIEKVLDHDLPTILKLAEQLGYPNSLEDFKLRFQEIHKNSDYGLFVAKSESDKILGYIQINREPLTLLAGPRADVAALVVDETERGSGVGKALLEQAEKWARENRLSLIRIRSNTKRAEAHRFYLRNKYEIAKSWHLFIKKLF